GDGSRCVDLSGTTAGTLRQVVHGLTPGQAYRLSFLMAGNPELIGPLPAIKRVRVAVGATTQEYSFDATGHNPSQLGWVSRNLDVVAADSSVRVSFVSLTDGLGGVALDQVVLAPGGEPPPPPPPPSSGTFDLSDGFSPTNNPNGAWALGWS